MKFAYNKNKIDQSVTRKTVMKTVMARQQQVKQDNGEIALENAMPITYNGTKKHSSGMDGVISIKYVLVQVALNNL